MRLSIPAVLAALVAIAGVVGLVLVATATHGGAAPGSGQQAFDAPGCNPSTYDGPSRKPSYLLGRNCPRPTIVVIRHVRASGTGWLVDLDASRSFDPKGGRIVRYEWRVDGRPRRSVGSDIEMRFAKPGLHEIVVGIVDDSGLTNEKVEIVRLR